MGTAGEVITSRVELLCLCMFIQKSLLSVQFFLSSESAKQLELTVHHCNVSVTIPRYNSPDIQAHCDTPVTTYYGLFRQPCSFPGMITVSLLIESCLIKEGLCIVHTCKVFSCSFLSAISHNIFLSGSTQLSANLLYYVLPESDKGVAMVLKMIESFSLESQYSFLKGISITLQIHRDEDRSKV